MKRIPLHWQIFIAIIAGILVGIFGSSFTGYIEWLGTLFLRLLKMIVIPLIFFLIVSAIGNVSSEKKLGALGLKAGLFYVITTLIAILTGIVMTLLFQPGAGIDLTQISKVGESSLSVVETTASAHRSIGVILMEIVPTNIFESFTKGDSLAVVFVAILLGAVLTRMKNEKGDFLKRFFNAGADLTLRITMGIITLAPLGVFSLIACRIAEVEGDSAKLAGMARSLGIYSVTVGSSLLFHFLVTMSVILLLFGLNPLKHLRAMSVPLMTGFSTATSNVTIPFSMEALTKEEGVSLEVAGFTIPLGATVNMNGTALYECVVVLFLAQANGMNLGLSEMFVIVFTALLSAIGTAGIPMASLVMITIILNAVHIPMEGIGLVLIVDRLFDMIRTAVNIYGDSCCAVCVAQTEGESLSIALKRPKSKE